MPTPKRPPEAARIPIKVAEAIAKEYGYDQVIVYARKVGVDGGEHMTTYGINKANCDVAAKTAGVLKTFIGWSGDAIGAFLRKVTPAALRPGMYVAKEPHWTEDEHRGYAIMAYLLAEKDKT